jgi:hydroxymethylpyrimidine pyrophosphatase-like HAD family hydrolase
MKFKFCGNRDCPDWLITEIIFLTKISSVKLRILSNQICKFILNKGENINDIKKILLDLNLSEKEASIVTSVLDFIFRNASKFDVDDNILNQELQQLGLPQEIAESISKVFKREKNKLREFLKFDVFSFNSINNIDYKFSYSLCNQFNNFDYINEKESEEINEENYTIKSLEKIRINLNFDDKYLLNIDKEILGKLIQDLEQCSKSIVNCWTMHYIRYFGNNNWKKIIWNEKKEKSK